MKDVIFLDTNIVLDLLGHRVPYYESIAKIATLAEKGDLVLCVSALSFATAHYVLAKFEGKQNTIIKLRQFKIIAQVVGIDEPVIEKGLNSNFADFEDALQYYCALKGNCSQLITRNSKDFKEALLPVMTADEYLASIGKK